ncbi:RsmB/NOP family class I SAM-dependent RNA methyltransferase [Actinophytocola algeriensis]|uniref:16S rRNA (Cytosine967-C5)-methyltransferase n=1 Tax=Actinophytocola algeriensis TaxID=1768010 RepID=A0A7W7VG56_9PSEU|nr:transcription antitermination factor NusB [Actinophytocola algeriensis]MBB4909031.1 16S rRNA (cytosine967-C5)-methyltransferase [Actinophytocola algeriensis]MBE1474581.1 16S rRNA (cytosine967-C5)-methyltransferase [Actinophytocola algeriensis]
MTQPRRRPARFSRPRTPHPPKPKGGPGRPPVDDPARQAALDTLREVRARDAYANLLLPQILRERRITGRDAALATELAYGACRCIGLLDQVLDACIDRPLAKVEPALLDVLRLGCYQLLRTRIPPHAAVASTVDLVRAGHGSRSSGFVNAVLRKVSERSEEEWLDSLAPDPEKDRIGNLAMREAHPRWVARVFADSLGTTGDELETALAADNERPAVHLVARPGEITAEELAAMTGGEVAPYSPYGVRLAAGAGDPAGLDPVRERLASVQDEGSQLCAVALTRPKLEGEDSRWLDLCAGPGGKSALLGALLAIQGGRLDAVEKAPHRARLVEQSTQGLPITVHVGDSRSPAALGLESGTFDRVLVDAPCTGLGSLRRRPESRWRRQPSDVGELTKLQRELLLTAVDLVRPGGVVGYVVCSPHLSETIGIVADVVRRTGVTALDTREAFPDMPSLGDGPYVQLWPHRHGTDAMFCALLRK